MGSAPFEGMTLSWALAHECINRAQLGKLRYVRSINVGWDASARPSRKGISPFLSQVNGGRHDGVTMAELTSWFLISLGHGDRQPAARRGSRGRGWDGGDGDRHFIEQGSICACKSQIIIICPDCCLLGSRRTTVSESIMSPWLGPRHDWQSVHKCGNYWMPTVCCAGTKAKNDSWPGGVGSLSQPAGDSQGSWWQQNPGLLNLGEPSSKSVY